MKTTLFVLILFLSSFALRAETAETKVDPAFSRISKQKSLSPIRNSQALIHPVQEVRVEALVKVRGQDDLAAARDSIEKRGGKIRSMLGQVFTVELPLSQVSEIAQSEWIEYIEANRTLKNKIDRFPASIRGNIKNQSKEYKAPYQGKGILVGILDSGIDCTHPDFKDENGNSRILFYWDQGRNGNGVPEIPQSTGVEYSGADLNNRGCRQSPDQNGHGTHVAGIAASSHPKYQGVAPQASILFVKLKDSSPTAVLDGVNYLFQKADQMGKPIVVNLSLGHHLGAHDNTSLFEQGLNALLRTKGESRAGKAIVVAAGNEGIPAGDAPLKSGIHASIEVRKEAVAFPFLLFNPKAFSEEETPIVSVWLEKGSRCTLDLDLHSLKDGTLLLNSQEVKLGRKSQLNTSFGDLAIDFTESENSQNHQQHAEILFAPDAKASEEDLIALRFNLVLRGDCKGNAWLGGGGPSDASFIRGFEGKIDPQGYRYLAGDAQKSVSIPGTASEVITVGSFMIQETFINRSGKVVSQKDFAGTSIDEISKFSSEGPTADGRIKPDLVAPGEPMISSYSSDTSISSDPEEARRQEEGRVDETHVKMEGTSMSSPFVAGFVALMFEKNPFLTAAQIKSYLKTYAYKDAFTSHQENNKAGAGKINLIATLEAIPTFHYPDLGNDVGSRGCGLTPQGVDTGNPFVDFSYGVLLLLIAGRILYRKQDQHV